MTIVEQVEQEQGDDAAPAFDKAWIRFEIRDGMRRVSCVVADEALEAVSGLTDTSTPGARRRSFDRFRTLIHEAALIRLRARAPGCLEPILITSRDLRSVPPQIGTPKFGTAARVSPTASALDGDGGPAGQEEV